MLAPDATAVRPSSLGIGEIETGALTSYWSELDDQFRRRP